MTHATTRRSGLSGDKCRHRLGHVLLDVSGGVLFRVATNLAHHQHCTSARVLFKQLEHVDEVHSLYGVSTDAHAGRLTEAKRRQLMHAFIRQRARARHHTDIASLVNVAGHNPNLALIRSNHAGTVRPNQPRPVRPRLRIQNPADSDHIHDRNSLGDTDHELDSSGDGFEDSVRSNRRRNIDYGCVGSRLFDGVGNGVKHRNALMRVAPFSRSHTTYNLGSVLNSLLGVKRAGLTGDSLHQEARIFID